MNIRKKYFKPVPVTLPDRTWPGQTIKRAPLWCSVDLRDGNQALPVPMGVKAKLKYFKLLTEMGFKNIEVGFPSASMIDFKFTRKLIEKHLVPDDVAIQVLCQCREDLIARTLKSLEGAKNVIFHLYISTSPAHRKYTFNNASREDVIGIALHGVETFKRLSAPLVAAGTRFTLQFSPESFSSTEPDFAAEICNAVIDYWKPTTRNKIIINLPETVQYHNANVYGDQIEWMSRKLKRRDSIILSIHTHNDRGTGTASSENGILAGADRVEGTLFGVGERTGNADIVNLSINMIESGVDPKLDFSNLPKIIKVYEQCTGMKVPPRHPYAGEYAFTALSGSHQDAIEKGMGRYAQGETWDVPYLHVDPKDFGREYEGIIRVNSQSGKGGAAYLLREKTGYDLPRPMRADFGSIVKKFADKTGNEVMGSELKKIFEAQYLNRASPMSLGNIRLSENGKARCAASLKFGSNLISIWGSGDGPLDSFCHGLVQAKFPKFKVLEYEEHALGKGADAKAAAYVCVADQKGKRTWGVATSPSIGKASIRALISALNRSGMAARFEGKLHRKGLEQS